MTRRTRTLLVGALVVTALLTVGTSPALAQQVTGLTAEQHQGYATLSWDAVPDATDYEIERTPVDASDQPTGDSVIVGLWQPIRTVTPDEPRFADAGFDLGARYQWRVRARLGSSNPQDWSEPVAGTTLPRFGSGAPWFGIAPGADLRTGWEQSPVAAYTTHEEELAYTAAVDALSDRVRVVHIGQTNPVSSDPDGREINMFVIGGRPDPADPGDVTTYPTAAEISDNPALLFYCNVHGNEPQGRESCLILARMLAFTTDPHILEILAETTVLIIPSSNPNGRAANTRGNETGQDLNRDHLNIEQPETKALARVFRDYTPEVGIDLHEGDSEDLPILSSRHLNVPEPLFNEAKSGLVEGWMYDGAAESGWWAGPYNNGGDSHEGILRNTLGLKNGVSMLAENRASPGNTRPNFGSANGLPNRYRKSYGSLWEEHHVLEYYWERRDEVHAAVEAAKTANVANEGPVVLRGSYPWPLFPAFPPHGLPNTDAPLPSRIIDPAPCGYFLTHEQYTADRFGGSLELRLGIHGVAVDDRPAGQVIRLSQPLRGLIPMMFDAASADPSPIVEGDRLFECPHATAAPESLSAATPEDTETTLSLTVANEAAEPDQDLNWTITEAAEDCSEPSDLGWVSVAPPSGTTASGSSSTVQVTLSAAGIEAKDTQTGLLCITTNDAGAPLIEVPLTLKVLYPFGGFQSPVGTGLNEVRAGANVPLKFELGGDRGLGILAAGSPSSQRVDCSTLEPLGGSTPATTPGNSGLTYEAGTYQFNWKTSKAWSGTCRALTLALDDGSEHVAYFRFS
jgi:hypothetical protein